MYSQQEYDMVRRQTMQIEAEKRAFLRFALITVTVLFSASLVIMGWMFKRYSESESLVSNAQSTAEDANAKFQEADRERKQLKGIMERNTSVVKQQNQIISSTKDRVLSPSPTASDAEVASMAQAIFDSNPGHVIHLNGMPADSILRRYTTKSGDKVKSFILVAGQLDDRWVLYSNLVRNQSK